MQDVTVSAGGRVVIPADYRKALGVKPGDTILMNLDEKGGIRMYTRAQALQWAQDHVCSVIPPEVSLTDELIRERREEAARE